MKSLFLYVVKVIYGKEVLDMLAMIYASLIIKGKKTMEQVPESLKAQVQEILDDVA